MTDLRRGANVTCRRSVVLGLVTAFVVAWVVLGLGYWQLEKACYESRHLNDREPEVFGGAVGLAFSLAFWPVFQASAIGGDFDCKPRPGPPLG